MFLKCETTLYVYEYKNRTVLCRVRVLLANDNSNKNGHIANTCRSISPDQWNDFDKELKSWLNLHENTISSIGENDVGRFNVKPNIRVKIKKSKLVIKDFMKCVQLEEYEDTVKYKEQPADEKAFPCVLDCFLEQTAESTHTPTLCTDEYEPLPTTSKLCLATVSPLSYVPYTPSKRNRRFCSEYQVKTPGYDLAEDIYSPKPLDESAINNNVAQYKPAPICRRSVSFDSQLSTKNEVIFESEDERMSYQEQRSQSTRPRLRNKQHNDVCEYVPLTQDIETSIPAYKPTPIEESLTTKPELHSKKIKRTADHIKEIKTKDKDKLGIKKNINDNVKYKTKSPTDTTVPKRSTNSSITSEDEFEQAFQAIEKKFKKEKKMLNRNASRKIDNTDDELDIVFLGNNKQKTDTNKKEISTHDKKMKDKAKQKSRDHDENAKSSTKDISARTIEDLIKTSSTDTIIRRSERSTYKPNRYMAQKGEENKEIRQKVKSQRCSPLKSKDLFGTDDDDDEVFFQPYNDSKKNGSNKLQVLKTPISNKHKSSTRSPSTSSSSSKKKRKQTDCEQEKAGMTKWLGKKGTNSLSSSDKKSRKPDEKYSSSSKEKSVKTSKSSKEREKKERPKAPTPQPMNIDMPSKEELEAMRTKFKIQREENEKVKKALEKIQSATPKAVEHLSLNDMTVSDLLATLNDYKSELDVIFEKNRKKDHVKGNDGINHCLVIGLIDQRIQLKMLENLSDMYNTSNSIAHATLYANALLPEWIIRIFMDKYKFSRNEAIEQIQNQDAYRSYMDGQNENSLTFDD